MRRRPDDRPPQQQRAASRARRLAWLTVAFLAINLVVFFLAMGTSQAMKTAWLDDMVSLVPPIVFLANERVRRLAPTRRFPYGFARAADIAFLLSSFALAAMGGSLLVDAVTQLARGHRPTIGTTVVLDHQIWAGWPMIAAAAWGGIPAMVLARMKAPLAKELSSSALHADADMGKADWLVSVATFAGVFGIGFGFWWADAVAAAIISFDILGDGLKNLRRVFTTLLDRRPQKVDGGTDDDLVQKLVGAFAAQDFADAVDVRMHQRGESVVVDVLVVPAGHGDLTTGVERSILAARATDWRIGHVTVTPVASLPPDDGAGVRWTRDDAELPGVRPLVESHVDRLGGLAHRLRGRRRLPFAST